MPLRRARRTALSALGLAALVAVLVGAARPSVPAGPILGGAEAPAGARVETAVFAGGCFWSMEKAFEDVRGVHRAVSGFTGGTRPNPTYESTFTDPAGHLEAVQVVFDPGVVSYAELVRLYWHNVDPTNAAGQFCDRGPTYRTAIFPQTASQRRIAEASLRLVEGRMSRPVATRILPAAPFYALGDEHQDFARLNPTRYERYRVGCRRDVRLRELWGDLAGVAGDRI